MAPSSVLHVAPYSEWAWAYGGIPRVLAAQTSALADLGVTTTVAATDAGDRRQRLARPADAPARGPYRRTTEAGVRVEIFPNLSNDLAARLQLYLPSGLGRYLAAHGRAFTAGHLHACRNVPGVIAARHLRRLGVPYVLQPNGTAPRIESRRWAKAVFDLVAGRAVLRGAAALVAVTEFERRQLQGLGLDCPIEVVPNPVDLSEHEVAPDPDVFRQRWHLGDRPLVLYLGQLSPRKRIDLALQAVAAMPPGGRADLVIAGGDMGRRRALESLARNLGIASRVVFTGVLEGRRRLEALAAADAVVYPSKDEIFGLVPLEALLSGSPVVVSDDCGCGEVIGAVGGGLVVEHGSVEALGSAIADLLASPEAWRDRVDEAADLVRRRFAAPVVAAQLAELYERVADDGARAGR